MLLIFGLSLLLAVLFSEWSRRTLLSSAVLFLVVGIVVGPAGLRLVALEPDAPMVTQLSELALFVILFSDGLILGVQRLRSGWALPGRALLLGLPITAAMVALLAHVLFEVT